MWKRLYRQCWRLIVSLCLVAAALVLAGIDNPELMQQIKHDMAGQKRLARAVLGLTLLAFSFAISVIIAAFLPRFRRGIEVAALTFLLIELAKWAGAYPPDQILFVSGDLLAFFLIFLLLDWVFLQDLWGRIGLRLTFDSTRSAVLRATPAAVRAALIPDADAPGCYWTGSVIRIDRRPDLGPDVLEIEYPMGKRGSLIQIIRPAPAEAPWQDGYRFDSAPDTDCPGASRGEVRLRCEDLGDGRVRVHLAHRYPKVGIGLWLFLWFEDLVGSELDAVVARLEGRRDRSLAGWAAEKMAVRA